MNNLYNFNIYTEIRKLSNQNVSTFMSIYYTTLNNTEKILQGYLVIIFSETTVPVAIINFGF